ncbi:hypothetical protein SteCoe_19009 [Stentor coeruleus]|uniref:Uncharacterized protein n=1 Tax=Stentor coeruleus TaxID=5963 RepID=A0A1R2BVR4_9CILI|nr:hypothetical protein SteCoe_19009 [Stentor coeruleus]
MQNYTSIFSLENIRCYKNCKNPISSYCSCNKQSIYMCSIHEANHWMDPGAHKLEKAFIDMPQESKENSLKMLSEKILEIRNIKDKYSEALSLIVSKIEESSFKIFFELNRNLEKLEKAQLCLRKNTKIFHRFVKEIDDLKLVNVYIENFSTDTILTPIQTFFNRISDNLSIDCMETYNSSLRMQQSRPVSLPCVLAFSQYAFLDQKIQFLKDFGLAVKEKKPITHLSLSPDGKFAVSCEESGMVKIWDISSKAKIVEIPAHKGQIYCLEMTKDSLFAITAGLDSIIKVWSLESRRHQADLISHTARISCTVQFCNKLLVSGGWDGTICIWDLGTFKLKSQIRNAHRTTIYGSITTLSITKGDNLASGDIDGTIKIWNLSSLIKIHEFKAHSVSVKFLQVTKNFTYLVSAGQDKVIKIWNLNNMIPEVTLKGHKKNILSMMISNNDLLIASISEEAKIYIWNIQEKRKHGKIKSHRDIENWLGVFPDIECYSKFLKG